MKKKILLKMTGSIAAFKVCGLLSKLIQSGYEVRVVMSPAALQFVGRATIEGLGAESVASDLWSPGRAMEHIHWMRWADLVLVAPASSHFINRAAYGIGDDLLTTMFLAHDFKKPYLIAPAMNTSMYLHPTTQASIKRLADMGITLLESSSGVLACGETGYGRLLEPDLLKAEIEKIWTQIPSMASSLMPRKVSEKRILITGGGTSEEVDSVRKITNTSTGKTSAFLADQLFSLGFSVTLLTSQSGVTPTSPIKTLRYQGVQNLKENLQDVLKDGAYSVVIHAAAVSDFIPSEWQQGSKSGRFPITGKLDSATDLEIKFKSGPKLIQEIHTYSPKPFKLIGFKLTSGADQADREKAVQSIFGRSTAAVVVANDAKDLGGNREQHRFTWHERSGVRLELENTSALADQFAQYLFANETGGPS